MGQPTITDWLQAAFAGAAFLLAGGSLIWQAVTRYSADQDRLTVEVEREGPGYWILLVSYRPKDRANAIELTCTLLGEPSAAVLFNHDNFPMIHDGHGNYSLDFAGGFALPGQRTISGEMVHQRPPSTSAILWLLVRGPEEDRPLHLELVVRTLASRRRLTARKMFVSPIA
jgi:hypothetical protein